MRIPLQIASFVPSKTAHNWNAAPSFTHQTDTGTEKLQQKFIVWVLATQEFRLFYCGCLAFEGSRLVCSDLVCFLMLSTVRALNVHKTPSSPPPSPNFQQTFLSSGCVCMSASMSSRGHWTPTHWHKQEHLLAQAAESNNSQEYVHWCNPGASDSSCLQLYVYFSHLMPRQFLTFCTCDILEAKTPLFLLGV